MTSAASTWIPEFLETYPGDARIRWSPQDLAAQQEFVNGCVAGRRWLDWSTPSAAAHLVQAARGHIAVGAAEKYEALVLAGPVVELIEPAWLFRQAAAPLGPGGCLVGILPCLRDNSPESRLFADLAARMLWPYHTAEEILEMLRENGWQPDPGAGGFAAVPRFNEAVLKDELGFKGFRGLFDRLTAEGYDPMEVGWGELRLAATLRP
jgi:hypothetical protein